MFVLMSRERTERLGERRKGKGVRVVLEYGSSVYVHLCVRVGVFHGVEVKEKKRMSVIGVSTRVCPCGCL